VAEVPWYREAWVADRVPPMVAAADAEREAFRFYPVSAPFRPGEAAAVTGPGLALLDALDRAAGPLRATTVVECVAALAPDVVLSRPRGVTWTALVDAPDPDDDPAGRQAARRRGGLRRLHEARRPLLVGSAAQVAAAASGNVPAVVRLGLDDPALARAVRGGDDQADATDVVTRQPLASPGRAVVAVDPLLGPLAGVDPGCGRLHLAWRALAARPTGGGVAITVLRRTRPRRVDVLPTGAEAWDVAPCPEHGDPILSPRT
jgi:hypothetical protein